MGKNPNIMLETSKLNIVNKVNDHWPTASFGNSHARLYRAQACCALSRMRVTS